MQLDQVHSLRQLFEAVGFDPDGSRAFVNNGQRECYTVQSIIDWSEGEVDLLGEHEDVREYRLAKERLRAKDTMLTELKKQLIETKVDKDRQIEWQEKLLAAQEMYIFDLKQQLVDLKQQLVDLKQSSGCYRSVPTE